MNDLKDDLSAKVRLVGVRNAHTVMALAHRAEQRNQRVSCTNKSSSRKYIPNYSRTRRAPSNWAKTMKSLVTVKGRRGKPKEWVGA